MPVPRPSLSGRLLFSLCSVVIGLFLRQCGSANEITHAGNGECQESTFWRICQPGIDDAFSDPYDIRRRPSQSFRDLPPSCTRFFSSEAMALMYSRSSGRARCQRDSYRPLSSDAWVRYGLMTADSMGRLQNHIPGWNTDTPWRLYETV